MWLAMKFQPLCVEGADEGEGRFFEIWAVLTEVCFRITPSRTGFAGKGKTQSLPLSRALAKLLLRAKSPQRSCPMQVRVGLWQEEE